MPSETSSSRRYQTIGYYLTFIALGLVSASLGPTLLELAAQTGSVISQISILFVARSLGYLVGSVGGGRTYDVMRGHPLMAGVLLSLAFALLAVPLIPVLWLLALLTLLIGVMQGAIDVGGNTLLLWLHGDEVGPFMNGLHFFFGIGASLSPLIIAQTMQATGGIRWAYWILAVLVVPPALWLLRFPSPQIEDADTDGATAAAARNHLLILTLIGMLFFFYVGAERSIDGWIAAYATKSNLATATRAAYLNSIYWGALTAGRLLSIPLAKRFAPRTLLTGDLIGCLLSVGVMTLFRGAPWAVWIGTFGMGLSMASIFPTLLSFAGRQVRITGQITGGFFVWASAGGMSVPWLIGQLFERIGPHVTMFTILADIMIAIAIFGALTVTTRRREAAKST